MLDAPVNVGRRRARPPKPWKLALVDVGLGARLASGGTYNALRGRRGGPLSGLIERSDRGPTTDLLGNRNVVGLA